MKKGFLCVILMVCLGGFVKGQSNQLLDEARALERQYNTTQAVLKYEQSLKENPNQLSVIVRLVEIYCFELDQVNNDDKKTEQLNKAKELLLIAKSIDSTSPDYLYSQTTYLGKLIEISPVKEKAQITKSIKQILDQALAKDPNHVKCLYSLANWNQEVASLNPAVKAAMKVIFGGLPPASLDMAIELHQKARKLNPGFLANNLELALLYKKTNQPSKAVEILEAQMKLPTKTKEELEIKNKSKQLLQSFQ
jgi:tetratricopeptide (TPR) repeat protein